MAGFCKFVHGLHGTKEYNAWKRIKGRCYNKNNQDYKDYGGCGILMDESFKSDFLSFLGCIGNVPDNTSRWSVDRIDNTKGYIKGNIRWAKDTQQARNKGSYKNNSTGVNGVYWNKTTCTFAVATWYENIDGKLKQRTKYYSTNKYGLLPAFAMACKHREEQIARLNSLGYGYSENHGK